MLTIRTPFFAALALVTLTTAARAERPYIAWAQAFDRDDATATQRSVGVVMDAAGNVIITGYRNEAGGDDS